MALSDDEPFNLSDGLSAEAGLVSTAERGATLLAQHADTAERARRKRTASANLAAARKSKLGAQAKEAATTTKQASRQCQLHFAGLMHALNHGKARQAEVTGKLDVQASALSRMATERRQEAH